MRAEILEETSWQNAVPIHSEIIRKTAPDGILPAAALLRPARPKTGGIVPGTQQAVPGAAPAAHGRALPPEEIVSAAGKQREDAANR